MAAFPPGGDTAGQNFSRMLIEKLSISFDIDVIYFRNKNMGSWINSEPNVSIVREISITNFKKILNCLKVPFLYPLFSARFRLSVLFYIRRTQRDYDYIYFDFSQVFIYSLFIHKCKKLLMAHDVIYQSCSRRKMVLSSLVNILCKYSEYVILRYSGASILCFSDKDRWLIKKTYAIESHAVRFFIDEKLLALSSSSVDVNDSYCFFGAWGRKENYSGLVWFLDKVLPHVDSEFIIIGGGLRASEKLMIEGCAKVKYLGFVENPYVEIRKCKALIAPIFEGAGVKVKVIEALALGVPVIGTDVAFEGIDIDDLAGIVRCSSDQEFVNACKNLEKDAFGVRKERQRYFLDEYEKKPTVIDFLKLELAESIQGAAK